MTDWLNKTHVGDCRELLRTMATAGVRAQTCVTSPPYFGLRDYGMAAQIGLETTPAEYVEQLVAVFRAVRNVLADDGTLWLNLGDSYATQGGRGEARMLELGTPTPGAKTVARARGRASGTKVPEGTKPKDLLGIPWRVAFALQADGWYLRSDIIWHKPNPMPESVTDRPTRAHEYVFLLTKDERYYFDAASIAEQTQCDRVRGPALHGSKDTNGNGGLSRRSVSETRNCRSVWSITTESFSGAHFATFPKALVTRCILAGSRPDDIVIDPFMGSGTTGQVATDLGRNFIGCELNPEYVDLHDMRRTTIGMQF